MAAAESLRALLTRAIDYAGLFPPASLTLAPALRNHAEYTRTADAWMLGAFVLPGAKFDEAAEFIRLFDQEHPLQISLLGPKTDEHGAFVEALRSSMAATERLVHAHSGRATITQIEMPLPPGADLSLLVAAREILGALPAYWEAPPAAARETIELIAQHNESDKVHPFGYKLRTGGVTPDAFPTAEQLSTALVSSARFRVPIKFTAGLHHPCRSYHDTVQTKMHGFLNVLGAGVLAAEHRWDEQQTVEMLLDEEPSSFAFSDEAFSWHDVQIATDQIRARRELVTSLGSCSFDEPRDDLRALNLL